MQPQSSDYLSVRAIIQSPISLILTYLFANGAKSIYHGASKVLDPADLLLYAVSGIHSLIILADSLSQSSYYLIYVAEILQLMQAILIASNLCFYILSERFHSQLEIFAKSSIIGLILIAIAIYLDIRNTESSQAYCGACLWTLFSFFINLIALTACFLSCRGISLLIKEEKEQERGVIDPVARQLSLQILNREKEDFFLISTAIMTTSLFELVTLYSKFPIFSETPEEFNCSIILVDSSLIGFKGFILLLEVVGSSILDFVIYFVCYYEKKEMIEESHSNDIELELGSDNGSEDLFGSLRSQLIDDMVENSKNPQNKKLARQHLEDSGFHSPPFDTRYPLQDIRPNRGASHSRGTSSNGDNDSAKELVNSLFQKLPDLKDDQDEFMIVGSPINNKGRGDRRGFESPY